MSRLLLFGFVAWLLAGSPTGVPAAEVETRTHTVSRVKGALIYTEAESVFRGDTKTKVVKKTATGEEQAKFEDIKPGDRVEIQTEKGAVTKVTILGKK